MVLWGKRYFLFFKKKKSSFVPELIFWHLVEYSFLVFNSLGFYSGSIFFKV